MYSEIGSHVKFFMFLLLNFSFSCSNIYWSGKSLKSRKPSRNSKKVDVIEEKPLSTTLNKGFSINQVITHSFQFKPLKNVMTWLMFSLSQHAAFRKSKKFMNSSLNGTANFSFRSCHINSKVIAWFLTRIFA
jgi:hypothetical protein